MIGTLIGLLAALTLGSPAQAQARTLPAVSATAQAATATKPQAPLKRRTDSLGIKTSAPSAFVADLATGSVLFAKDPHRVLPIASLTKLVTAMVFLDQKPDFNQTLTYQAGDFDQQSTPVFSAGEQLSYGDVFKSMLVGSVNASANALARVTLGKEKFVAAMNNKMRELGLKSPVFVEPSGLDPANQADAADIAAIIATATGYPQIREADALPMIVVHGKLTNKTYSIKSTNLLLESFLNKKPYSVVVAKTGSLPQAGYCMAQVTRNDNGHEVVAVELGNDNHFGRFQDIKVLTSWAFNTYEWR